MNVTIACLACGQGNRIPTTRVAENPKCGTCGAPLVKGVPTDVSLDVLRKAARLDTIPLIVDFWAGWCGPCRAMAPEFAKAAGEMKGQARFAKLDTEAFPEAGARYGIRGIPLLIAFRNGQEIGRQTGARSGPDIAAWIGTAAKAR